MYTLITHTKTIALVTVTALLLALLPGIARAADNAVVSLEIDEMTSQEVSATATVDLTMVVGEAIPSSGGRLWFMARTGDGEDPSDSGMSFSGASVAIQGVTIGTQLEVNDPPTGIVALSFSEDIAPGSYPVTLTGVQNPSAATCIEFVVTSEEAILPQTEFAGSGYGAIGDATGCSALNEDEEGGGEDGDGPVEEPSDDEISTVVFGTNVEVSWETYPGVATYGFIAIPEDGGENVSGFTTTTSGLLTGLDPKSAYSVVVNGTDADGESVLVPYPGVGITTEKQIVNQRFNKLTIKKKKRRRFNVNYRAFLDRLVDGEEAYISRIVLVVKNKKKTRVVKRFKRLTTTKAAKRVKKKFTKKNRTYRVRMRAIYTTGEKTRWSKWKKVKLKPTPNAS